MEGEKNCNKNVSRMHSQAPAENGRDRRARLPFNKGPPDREKKNGIIEFAYRYEWILARMCFPLNQERSLNKYSIKWNAIAYKYVI